MGKKTSGTALERSDMADDREDRFEASPATRLLDALSRGDLNAALLEFRPTTIVRTEDRTWSLQGEEQVLYGLEDALNLFPGLVFDSHARHVGQGRVIEEARVRDLGSLDAVDSADAPESPDATGHGVDAGDAAAAPGGSGAMVLDRDLGASETPRLNMPMRLTVLHDDQAVHEIILSFPRALLRAALGERVDPLDMAVSEIQSAFVAPVGSGFTTHELGNKPVPQLEFAPAPPIPVPVRRPEPEPERNTEAELVSMFAAPPPPAEPEQPWRPAGPVVITEEEKPRRRAAVIVPLVVVLVAAIAAGGWWLSQGDNATPAADAKTNKPAHSSQKPKPSKKPSSGSASPTKSPSATKTDKPNVTLESDLAFPKNSAVLSSAAKSAIADLADQIVKAKLKGTVRVDGYTDNLGSAEHGLTLSRERAQAVAQYLRLSLGDYPGIKIVPLGHGENDPVASNATEAGREKNRRVTINLPEN
jgi:outer membrane protein OmpA-like peptidoglycan-associated protein